jgi:hypothetical protein
MKNVKYLFLVLLLLSGCAGVTPINDMPNIVLGDYRSLAINEEINLVVYDAGFAGQLEKSFQEDLKYSKQLTYEAWNSRSFVEKILELFSIPIKEQL